MREADEILKGAYSRVLATNPEFRKADVEFEQNKVQQSLIRHFRKIRENLNIIAVATGADFRRAVVKLEPTDVVTIAAGTIVGALASSKNKGVGGRLENGFSGAVMGMAASIYIHSIKGRR